MRDETSPPTDLPPEERAAIDHYHALQTDATHYELLGVAMDADRKAVRDAYFALSKRFHPDVYFKKNIGSYHEKVEGIFRALTRAYDTLSNARQRAVYDKSLGEGGGVGRPVRQAPVAAPPPRMTPPAGLREAAAQAQAQAQVMASQYGGSSPSNPMARGSSPSNPMARGSSPSNPMVRGSSPSNPAVVPVAPRPVYPDGVVVPPSLRTVLEGPAPRAPTPQPGPSPVVDEAVRQRALEAMARKLGGRRSATGSTPPVAPGPTAQQVADERKARAGAMVARAEEAQKAGDLAGALEGYKNALQVLKSDPTLTARIEAVGQLLRVQQVTEHIEKAKEAQRNRDVERAAMHWEKAWEGRREDPALLLNAAELLARAKEHKRAAELAQRAIGVDPKLPRAHALLATVFLEAGLKASARGAIENLARLDPDHAQLKELREKLGPTSLAEQFGLRGSR